MHSQAKEYPQSMKAVFLLVGTGLYWVWAISGLFSTIVWYEQEGGSWFYVVASNALTLILLCVLAKRFSPYIERMSFVVGSGVITCAGIVLATLSLNLAECSALLIPGALLTGIGSAPLILLWREASEQLASKTIQRLFISVAVVLATLFYLLFVSLPFVVTLIVCSLAPIGAAFLFRASYTPAPFNPSSLDTSSRPLANIPFLFFLCCFAFALIQGVYKSPFLPYENTISWTLAVSCAVLAMVLVLLGDFYLAKKKPSSLISRAFMPVLTILFSTLAFTLSEDPLLMSSLVFAGHWLFLVYLYSELDALCVRGLLGTQVLALGLCVIDLGYFIGMALGFEIVGVVAPLLLGFGLGLIALLLFLTRLFFSKEQERFEASGDLSNGVKLEVFSSSARDDMLEGIKLQCEHVARVYQLSEREREILFYLVCGKSAKTMASELYISYNTVKTHISHIYQKTEVHGREELVTLVTQEGDSDADIQKSPETK